MKVIEEHLGYHIALEETCPPRDTDTISWCPGFALMPNAVSEITRREKISLPGAGGSCCQAAASGQDQSSWRTRSALVLPDPHVTCQAGSCDGLSSQITGGAELAESLGTPSCSFWRSAVCLCRPPWAEVLGSMPSCSHQCLSGAVFQPGAEPSVWPSLAPL